MRAVIIALLLSNTLIAQKAEVFLFDLSLVGENYTLSNARYLSSLASNDVVAEPSFADTYQLLVTARDQTGQQDILRLNCFDNGISRITRTKDQEYHPKQSLDKQHITCIVYDSVQDAHIVWQYPKDLSSGGRQLVKLPINIRQYCFLENGWMALYEDANPSNLILFHPETGEKQSVSNKVGQCIQRGPDGTVIFIHKHAQDYWFLKRVSPGSRSEIVKKTIPDADCFTMLLDGSILMAKEGKLFHLHMDGDNLWREIANLESYGIDNITDLAFNGINMLAIVNER